MKERALGSVVCLDIQQPLQGQMESRSIQLIHTLSWTASKDAGRALGMVAVMLPEPPQRVPRLSSGLTRLRNVWFPLGRAEETSF